MGHFDFPKTFSSDSPTLWQPAQKFSQEEKLFGSNTFTFQTLSGLLRHFTARRKISGLLHVVLPLLPMSFLLPSFSDQVESWFIMCKISNFAQHSQGHQCQRVFPFVESLRESNFLKSLECLQNRKSNALILQLPVSEKNV